MVPDATSLLMVLSDSHDHDLQGTDGAAVRAQPSVLRTV
jgi:hypothetical protein